jgi:antitoxin StbD
MSYKIFADVVATLAELRTNPKDIIESSQGMPLAVMENNEPVFYCIPVQAWEDLVQIFEYLSADK